MQQVRTLLENPTRYHVVQKQKNQVRQYLHDSFGGADDDVGGLTTSSSAGSLCSVGSSVDAHFGPVEAAGLPMAVHSTPPGPALNHQLGPQMSSYPHAPSAVNRGHPNGQEVGSDPTTGAMSPSLSSVATSNSEVSSLFYYYSYLYLIHIVKL